MTVYLIVMSKSMVSLLLDVTEYPDLEVGMSVFKKKSYLLNLPEIFQLSM